jgi:hypothetical protein
MISSGAISGRFAYEKNVERFVGDLYRSPDGMLTVMVDVYVNEGAPNLDVTAAVWLDVQSRHASSHDDQWRQWGGRAGQPWPCRAERVAKLDRPSYFVSSMIASEPAMTFGFEL